jgi:PAS domain S-box-containing protein
MLALLADGLFAPFIPHGHCYLWKPGLVGLHLVSDSLIALAYYSIPLTLVYFVRKRQDLPFSWIFLLFGAFIVACGTTHIMEVWTLWHPHYWLSGFIKVITAAVSLGTAVLLVRLIPQALALPSPAQLEAANRKLEREIREHAATAAELQRALMQLTFHVENSPLGVIELNSEFRVQRWSKQAGKIFGWQAEEVLNQRLDEGRFVFEEDFPLVQQDMSHLLNGSKPHIMGMNRNYTKDGSIIYCEWYNSALWNPSGELVSILSLALDVTERTRAEQALKESEARYRTLIETSPDAISVTDLDGKLLFCNRQVATLHGYESDAELVGRQADDLIAPDGKWRAALSLQKVLKQGSIRDVEYAMLRKDGSQFPAEVSASLIRDSQGNPQAIIGLVRDITERKLAENALKKAKEDLAMQVDVRTAQLKQVNEHLLVEIQERALAEEALRKSEARLHQSLRAAQMGAWDWDMISDRITWSQGAAALFGLVAETPVSSYMACLEYVHPDDKPMVIQSLRRTVETGIDYDVEARVSCPDGMSRWVACKGALIRNPNGTAVRMTGTVMNITKRKQVELALERERQQLRQIIASAPVAMAMLDTQMRYLAHSQKWLTVQGLEGKTIIGCNHYDILPDLPERWKIEYQRALQGEVLSASEDVWERNDGTKAYLRWAIHPWYTPDGEIGGIVIATDSINELVEAREAALEVARIKSQFLANMSHEIRTPMNGILGVAELLLQTSLTPQQLEYGRTIRSSAEHLLTVINDILDFSKLEVGEMQLETIDFDLDSCIESVVDVLGAQAQEKGLELAILVDSDVPRQLQGDPNRLRQILLNLVGNAVKFTDAGQVVVKASVVRGMGNGDKEDKEDKGDKGDKQTRKNSSNHQFPIPHSQSPIQIRFEVTDTGIGISADDQQKLFQSFSQVDASTTRQYGGTGLGLVICKQLVALMGGAIGVESVLGEGSTFWLTASFDTPMVPEVTACPLVFRKLKVLVVSDRTTTRQAVCCALRRSAIPNGSAVPTRLLTDSWDMQVDEAEDTPATLNALRSSAAQGQPYDMAILDLQLPEPLGAMLVPMIRCDPELAQTQLIVMTTSDRLNKVQELEVMDISGYLIKPVRASQLFDCLMSALAPKSEDVNGWVSSIEEDTTSPEPPKLPPSSLKILLVEDHEVNQMVTLNQLAMLGFEADCVGNGQEAIAKLEQQDYDIIFMDCQMPILDGYETTQEIRRREGSERHTIVIALTAHALPSDREKCLAAGMDDYLSKPIAQDALGAMLERWVKPTVKPSVVQINDTVEPHPQHSISFPDDTPLDLERLNAISRGKVTLQQQLVQAFIKNAQPGLEQMRLALQVNDCEIIVQQAHRIKGASANVGVKVMPEVTAQLERQARDNNLEGAIEKLEVLEKQLERVKAFVENWCIS